MGYNLAMSEVNNQNNGNKQQIPDNKINCVFKTTQGVVTNVLIDQGKTMSELIKTYLNRMGKPELFGKKDGVCFLFNATKIDFNCNTKVEDFFKFNAHPTLIVNDVNNNVYIQVSLYLLFFIYLFYYLIYMFTIFFSIIINKL